MRPTVASVILGLLLASVVVSPVLAAPQATGDHHDVGFTIELDLLGLVQGFLNRHLAAFSGTETEPTLDPIPPISDDPAVLSSEPTVETEGEFGPEIDPNG